MEDLKVTLLNKDFSLVRSSNGEDTGFSSRQYGFDFRTDHMHIQKIRKHRINICFDGKNYFIEDKLFNIYESEESVEKLISEYIGSLEQLILEYGIEEDKNLTKDAINLKKKINRYLKYTNG